MRRVVDYVQDFSSTVCKRCRLIRYLLPALQAVQTSADGAQPEPSCHADKAYHASANNVAGRAVAHHACQTLQTLSVMTTVGVLHA